MKNLIFFLFVFCVGFLLVGFQLYKKEKANKIDREQKLNEIISKSQILELPIFLNIYNSEKNAKLVGLTELVNPNKKYQSDIIPVLGILPDTTNYITFLAYGIGDVLYPTLITFDKKGNLIEEKSILLNDNFNIFEEVELSSQTSTVNLSQTDKGLEITLLEITKGQRYREFESNTENTSNSDSLFCQKITQTGFLNEKGKVIFDDKIVEDCR